MKPSFRALTSCLAALLVATVSAFADVSLTENFSTNPLAPDRWTFGIGSNANTQFVHQNSAPAFLGDAPGSLAVHLDSSLPTARLDLALGETLTDAHNFAVTAQFSMSNIVTNSGGGMQIAFGLVNHDLTGGSRTGTLTTGGDTFSTVEFNYFPAYNPLFGTGPSLAPVVIGADEGTGSSFDNFQSLFGADSDLRSNPPGQVNELPSNVNLQATLTYNAAGRTITLEVARIEADGSLTILSTGVPTMTLSPLAYNSDHPFTVDSLAIMAYHDGTPEFLTGYPDFETEPSSALQADVTFQKLTVTSTVPEPTTSALLLGFGLLGATRLRPRAQRSTAV